MPLELKALYDKDPRSARNLYEWHGLRPRRSAWDLNRLEGVPGGDVRSALLVVRDRLRVVPRPTALSVESTGRKSGQVKHTSFPNGVAHGGHNRYNKCH